jgi:tRNA-splicing ligase RtcB
MGTRDVVLGLGANLGGRRSLLRGGAALLGHRLGADAVRTSPVWETAPLGPPQPTYFNAAVSVRTDRSLDAVLEAALSVEAALGRERRVRWGARTLDVDVLWHDGEPLDRDGLTVPHAGLTTRPFALAPLLSLHPDARDEHGAPLGALPAAHTRPGPRVAASLDEGFTTEVLSHTADEGFEVIATDRADLLAAAAEALAAVIVDPASVRPRELLALRLDATDLDDETRLVTFLSECLNASTRCAGESRRPGRHARRGAHLRRRRADDDPRSTTTPAVEQVANVASLPGIVGKALAMPDIHWGYGFPIGGVAAFDPDNGGIVSPGRRRATTSTAACGSTRTALDADELVAVKRRRHRRRAAARTSPRARRHEARHALPGPRRHPRRGRARALAAGIGTTRPRAHRRRRAHRAAEPDAREPSAPASAACSSSARSARATTFSRSTASPRSTTPRSPSASGCARAASPCSCTRARAGSVTRCAKSPPAMIRAAKKGDRAGRQAARVRPARQRRGRASTSGHGRRGELRLRQPRAARAPRHRRPREALGRAAPIGASLLYDVCHNIAKWEEHEVVDGRAQALCVHRKGATRAFGPGHRALPERYRDVGQPVIIPGDMGRYSYVLAGLQGAMDETFGSACHGAGRLLSRADAKNLATGSRS